MAAVTKSAEVLRVLERYLVEVVERHELCPWARSARERDELVVGILWGTPSVADWLAEARRLFAAPSARVAMVIGPELAISYAGFAQLRDRVAAQLPTAGIAAFHPSAPLDLGSPARLVPFLRRAPDPLLQLVPLVLLDAIRGPPPVAGLAQQAGMLAGHADTSRPELAERIAAANHVTVVRAHPEIAATLDDIAADRRAAYARVGISAQSSSP
jgi:hypothetical protein